MKWETWRYLHGGKVKHALSYASARSAACGTGPFWFDDWHGTESQDEYENLAARPACKACVKRGYQP